MLSRLVNSERSYSVPAEPRWLGRFALATVVAGAAVYGAIALTTSPRTVEAPGFLTALGDGELDIAAYVPPTHPEYAISGARATVLFPDGSQRAAEIAPGSEGAAALPNAEMLGDARLGTLVRMEFIDTQPATRPALVEGLPVKVQFEEH